MNKNERRGSGYSDPSSGKNGVVLEHIEQVDEIGSADLEAIAGGCEVMSDLTQSAVLCKPGRAKT